MATTRSPLPTVAAFLGLFLGGAVIGLELAEALAQGSRVAVVVSFFALPVAFATGLQAWYGLALFSLIPRLLRWLAGVAPPAVRSLHDPPALPGAFVFLPISSGVGGLTGLVVGLLSPTHSVWLVAAVYWLVGTVHGVVAWRLARRGVLLPPEVM